METIDPYFMSKYIKEIQKREQALIPHSGMTKPAKLHRFYREDIKMLLAAACISSQL